MSSNREDKNEDRPAVKVIDSSDLESMPQSTQQTTPRQTSEEDEKVYPKGMALFSVIFALWITIFLVALDRTILATAVPKITDEFHSLSDVGWYSSAYMLTSSATLLIYGRIYKFYNIKWVLLFCISIFEIGSVVCGAAPTSIAFIIGRAIAGLGSAGLFTGSFMTLFHMVPLHDRPKYSGLFGATFGVASVTGPLLGGAFTDNVSWRWCFYINLPFGAIAIAIILFLLELPAPKDANVPIKQQLAQLDPLGTAVFMPSIICLILALQWGGTTHAWSSWRIILLLTLFSVLIVTFGIIQVIKGESATIPPRILLNRSISAGAFFNFCIASCMMLVSYYLPIWFQAVKGTTALESGIRFIPTVLSLVFSSIVGGQLTSRIGYYVPNMFASSVLASIGAGLLATLNPSSGHAYWIGYQVLLGLGLGLGLQVSSLAAQAVLKREDVSIGTAITMFTQQLGGAIFVAVGQNVFINELVSGLVRIPGLTLSPADIVQTGATDLQSTIPEDVLPAVLDKYDYALTRTFLIAASMVAVGIVGAIGMEWKNIKRAKKPAGLPAEKAADGGENGHIEKETADAENKDDTA